MKTKKNKKYNSNNSTSYSNFARSFFEFNNSSENEKYEKCFKLIEDSTKIKVPNENSKLAYYYGCIAELYYYASKKESIRYNFSNGRVFNIDAILEEKNREYLEKIINYKKISLENYLKCLEIIKNTNELSSKIINCSKITEGIRITSQELSIIYYIINEEEKFLLYGKYAVEYDSLNAIYVFLKYYCDRQDYDNASIYYELMRNHRLKYNNMYSNSREIILKKIGCSIYYQFLYELGMYEDSLNVAKEFKKYVIDNELIENKLEFLKDVNKHIEKCKVQIDKTTQNQYEEGVLLEYFDKEILELMSEDNKIYILTSLNIYKYMKSSKITMDYSATLMPILKAIENIIFEIIADKYHEFIIKKNKEHNIDFKFIKAFVKNGRIAEKKDRLELGNALSLIGYRHWENNEVIINRYFKEFCIENNVENSRDVIIKMYNELDELVPKRNLVAHKNRIYEECVKECYDILLDNIKFINYLYTNFKFVFEDKKYRITE